MGKAEHYLLTARAGMQDIDGRLVFVNHKGEPTSRPEWLTKKPYFAE